MAESGATELGRETVIRLFDEFRADLNRLGITAEDLLRGERHAESIVIKSRRTARFHGDGDGAPA